jgi:predicted Zn-dependent protease
MRLTSRGKRRILVICVISAIAVVVVIAFVSLRGLYRARLVEQSRQEGLTAYRNGDYEETLAKLSYVLSPNSTDMECLLAFADSRSRVPEVNNRHLTTAVAYYNSALKVDSKNFEALSKLLELYSRMHYRAEMGDVADRIVALQPDHVDAWTAKAALAYHNQDFNQVIGISERMSRVQPNEMSWRRLHIKAMQARGDREQDVLAACSGWAVAEPSNVNFRLLQAQILSEYGRQPEARMELAYVAEHGVETAEMLESAVAMLELLEMRAEADALINKSKLKFPGLSWVYEAAIRRHWQASRMAEALKELKEAEQRFGNDRIALLKWNALLHIAGGDSAQAESALQTLTEQAKSSDVEERDDTVSWVNAIRARLDPTLPNWRQLAETFEYAISRQSGDPVLLFLLADHYRRIGEHQLALTLLNRAANVDPNWLALHIARAEALLRLDRAEEAFAIVGAVLKRSPTAGTPVYQLLCRAWYALGPKGDQIAIKDAATQSALTLVDLVSALHQQNNLDPQVARLLVDVRMRRGETDQAKSIILAALSNSASNPQILLTLAEASLNWNLQIEPQLLDAIAARPGLSNEEIIAHSRILMRLNRADDALAVIDRALAQGDSQSIELRWERAQLILQLNQPNAESEMLAMISAEQRPPLLLDLLKSESVWSRGQVVYAVIDRLRDIFANRSPRVQLAYAEYLYRFKKEDASAIAEALDLVNGVLREFPESRQALSLMASLQVSGDDPDSAEAIRYLKRAVDLQPKDLDLLARLVTMLQEHGDFETARQFLMRSTAGAEDNPDLVRMQSRFLEAQGEFDVALEKLKSLPEAKLDEQSRIRIGNLLARTGDVVGAESHFNRIVELPGATTDSFIAAASFHGSNGRLDLARALLERGVSNSQPALAAFHLGSVLMGAGEFGQAEVQLKRAAELDPKHVGTYAELTKLYAAIGSPLQARDAALRGLQLDPDNESVQAMLTMISSSLDQRDRTQLIGLLQRIERRNPGLERMLRLYGALAAPTDSDLDEAQKLSREFPRRSAVWTLAVTLHANAGRWDDAVRLAQQAVVWLPAEAAPHEACARLLIQRRRTEEALEMARAWRRLSRNDSLVPDSMIAALLLDLNRAEEAFRSIEPHIARLAHQPNRFPEQAGIAVMTMLESDRKQQADALIQPLIAQSADWRSRLLAMAAKLNEDAAKHLLLQMQPFARSSAEQVELAAAWTAFAKGFHSTDAFRRAEELVDQAAVDPAVHLESLILKADIATGLEDWNRAEELYRDALKKDPRNLAVLNNLACLLVRKSSNCDEAVTLARQAKDLANDNIAVLDTLAQALVCAGQYAEAEPVVQAIIAQHPRDPSSFVTLAEIRQRQGRLRDARTQLLNARQYLDEMKIPDRDVKRRADALEELLSDKQAFRRQLPSIAISRYEMSIAAPTVPIAFPDSLKRGST